MDSVWVCLCMSMIARWFMCFVWAGESGSTWPSFATCTSTAVVGSVTSVTPNRYLKAPAAGRAGNTLTAGRSLPCFTCVIMKCPPVNAGGFAFSLGFLGIHMGDARYSDSDGDGSLGGEVPCSGEHALGLLCVELASWVRLRAGCRFMLGVGIFHCLIISNL